MGESQKIKCFWSFAFYLSILFGKSTKLYDSGLCRFYFQAELAQSVFQFTTEVYGVMFVLKADNKIICIADHSCKTAAMFADNFFKPEIKDVVKIDVERSRYRGKQNKPQTSP